MEEKKRMKILSGVAINSNLSINESNVDVDKNLESIEIIDKFDYLKKAFKYILINNNSNQNPYHDLNHLMTVLKYCYYGAIYEGIVNEKELKELLIAAIFHDANHSGGKKTDDLNIKNAKKIIKEFVESQDIEVGIGAINDILDATQYPYVVDELSTRQAIIRDADLMQVYEYNWIQQNIGGLSSELNMDFIEFLKPQRKFLESIEFNTDWAKKIKKEKWKRVMSQFKMLEDACSVKLKS